MLDSGLFKETSFIMLKILLLTGEGRERVLLATAVEALVGGAEAVGGTTGNLVVEVLKKLVLPPKRLGDVVEEKVGVPER